MGQEISSNNSDIPASSVDKEKNLEHEYCCNCGAKLGGLYCHKCGQSSKSMIKFFGEVVKELLDDTIGYDSRIKHSIVPLLLRPGRITLDYIKGKRFFYVLPFRLYLITSLVLILLIKGVANTEDLKFDDIVSVNDNIVSVNKNEQASGEIKEDLKQKLGSELNGINSSLDEGSRLEQITQEKADPAESSQAKEDQIDGSDDPSLNWDEGKQQLTGVDDLKESWFKTFLQVINPKIKNWREHPKPLIDSIFEALPYMMFLILPLFAIFLKVFYAFSKRYYIEHLVFLLHNHAFIYMVMMLGIITEYIAKKLIQLESGIAIGVATGLDWFGTLLFYWMVIYVFLAMKRYYCQGWAATISKTLLLGFVYFVMLFFGFMMTVVYGAYQA